ARPAGAELRLPAAHAVPRHGGRAGPLRRAERHCRPLPPGPANLPPGAAGGRAGVGGGLPPRGARRGLRASADAVPRGPDARAGLGDTSPGGSQDDWPLNHDFSSAPASGSASPRNATGPDPPDQPEAVPDHPVGRDALPARRPPDVARLREAAPAADPAV